MGRDMAIVNIRALAFAVMALPLFAACKPAAVPVEDIRPVRTLTVGATPTTATNIYAGEVRARYESSLGFRVAGKVIARQVNVGEQVKAGQVLARLDPKDLQLGDAAAVAQVAAAQSQFTVTKNDLERVTGLFSKGYASKGEMDRYTTQYEAAKAQLEAVKAQRDQIANQASYSTLTADAAGVVTAVLVESGTVVAAGQPVVQLARGGAIEIAAAIPEDRVNTVHEGMAVQVSLWSGGDKTYAGTVRELSSAADPLTRTYALRVSVPQPPPEMKLRMTASVAIPRTGLPDMVHIPSPSMVTQNGKAGVWLVEPKASLVQFREVQFAGVEGNAILVASGLQPGDVVVTAGAAYLREGQKVKLLGAPLAAPAQASAKAG
ncbi:MAG: efflux RND transporter periplasmic adaptor subunit [Stagnimonas sp.]|nr:efflux RND transporter periplasmic adaptor subunit [Stagnimonas sp.]